MVLTGFAEITLLHFFHIILIRLHEVCLKSAQEQRNHQIVGLSWTTASNCIFLKGLDENISRGCINSSIAGLKRSK